MKKYFYVLFCAAVLIICGLIMINGNYSRYYSGDDLISRYQESNIIAGGEMDDALEAFIKTTELSLPKGAYKVSIRYSAGEPGNKVDITSDLTDGFGMISNTLDEREGSIEIPFELEQDTFGVYVSVDYGGAGELHIKNIEITSAGLVTTDTIFLTLLCVVCLVLLGVFLFQPKVHQWGREHKISLLILGFLLVTSWMASIPVLSDRVVDAHDVRFHLTRIEGIKDALLCGQFPVYVHAGTLNGYGHMASVYYPELFLYIPAVMRILGISLTTSYHVFLVLINFFTVGIAYFVIKRLFKSRTAGMAGAVFYGLALYRLVNLYTRGSLGEVLAMAFFPLVIYGIYEMFFGDKKKWIYAVMGITGILQSHILSTMMLVLFLLMFGVVFIYKVKEKGTISAILKLVSVSVLINLWYLVPFLQLYGEDLNIDGLQRNFASKAISFSKLFYPLVSPREISSGEGGMPIAVGIVILAATGMALYYVCAGKRRTKEEGLVLYSTLSAGLCLFLSSEFFPWKVVQNIRLVGGAVRTIQFPWRFFAFASIFLSISAAYGVYRVAEKTNSHILILAAVLILLMLSAGNIVDQSEVKETIIEQAELMDTFGKRVVGGGEYLYDGTDIEVLRERGNRIESTSGELTVDRYEKKGTNFTFSYKIQNQAAGAGIEVPLLYYKGYKAIYNDDIELDMVRGENNVMRIILPDESEGEIRIYYAGYMMWKLAFAVSVLTVLTLCFYEIRRRRKDFIS